MIKVRYTSIDRVRDTRTFKTLAGAQKFAHHRVGAHPEIGGHYAVSSDGVGKVTVEGATLADLFPALSPSEDELAEAGRRQDRMDALDCGEDPYEYEYELRGNDRWSFVGPRKPDLEIPF